MGDMLRGFCYFSGMDQYFILFWMMFY